SSSRFGMRAGAKGTNPPFARHTSGRGEKGNSCCAVGQDARYRGALRMNSRRWFHRFLSAALVCAALPALSGRDAAGPRAVFTPPQSDALLANPHMGWQTFQRPAKADKSLPAWLPSTVEYYRWRWKDIEPRQGEIDWAFIE